ncbi:MAG: hypothetical protein CMO66_05585 [Verrucomicrobiales bacterium]|nr:hypothetical protein [Verrucomicrobiales bacterium]MBR90725.1 hypothetical protein [Verrucomicrobiales bacterium]|tara:strand:- start:33 stop:515 length:483 start_codon:yes stop_codon:yes gene_type:complete
MFVFLLLLVCSGCSVLDRLSENKYETHYIPLVTLPDAPREDVPEPSLRPVLMENHSDTVRALRESGHELLGTSEFNTANQPPASHLPRHAKAVGAMVVVTSQKFDRESQRLENTREFVPGERVTVNGVTVETEGRWVNQVVVRDYIYYDYRASFLRRLDP